MPTLIFEGTDEPLDSLEFVSFLHLFRVAYVHSLDVVSTHTSAEVVEHKPLFIDDFSKGFRVPDASKNGRKIFELFHTDLGAQELRFVTINKSSPLEISCVGVVSALTLAVILSGGEVELGDFKFKLRPLGAGIKSLRTALGVPMPKRRNKGGDTENEPSH